MTLFHQTFIYQISTKYTVLYLQLGVQQKLQILVAPVINVQIETNFQSVIFNFALKQNEHETL